MPNLNDTFFQGHYKEIWKALIPAELSSRETEFMFQYFGLQPGQRVLDLMCGYGRHALALAAKGIQVTAVDNLGEYVDEIRESAAAQSLPLEVFRADVAAYEPEGFFDLVICMGNSLNFFNAVDTAGILRRIAAHLRPGGHFLLNSWSVAEIAIKNFKEKSWSSIGEYKFLTDSKFLFHPTRTETESIIIGPSGDTETRLGVDYIYSIAELEAMIRDAGLEWKEMYSIPGKKQFSLGEPRVYIIAGKP